MPDPVDGEEELGEDMDDASVVDVGIGVAGGIGLSPPPPSSVAPRGICSGLTGATTMPVGEEEDAAGCANLGGISPQFIDVVPLAAPPSNKVAEPELEAPGAPIIVSFAPEQLDIAGATIIGPQAW